MAEGRLQVRRRREQLGRDVGRRGARHRLHPDRIGRPTTSTARTGTARTSSRNCLLALDARTGKRLWHFQTIHHDLWDLDNVSAPQLVTVRHNGRRIDAVAHAGKTGFLYVFNRVTGEPLWPIEERPVPQTDVPGEQALADAAVPDEAGAVRPADLHGRRRQSVAADAGAVPDDARPRREGAQRHGPQGGLFIPPAVDETRSRCPATRADRTGARRPRTRRRGWCSSSSVNQVALLKLEDVTTRTGRRPRRRSPRRSGRASGRVRGISAALHRCATARTFAARYPARRRSSA